MFQFDETETLPTIPLPTLFVVGKSDIATRPFASKHMCEEVPHAELSILAPGGHMALMERNAQFAETIRAFSASCLQLKS